MKRLNGRHRRLYSYFEESVLMSSESVFTCALIERTAYGVPAARRRCVSRPCVPFPDRRYRFLISPYRRDDKLWQHGDFSPTGAICAMLPELQTRFRIWITLKHCCNFRKPVGPSFRRGSSKVFRNSQKHLFAGGRADLQKNIAPDPVLGELCFELKITDLNQRLRRQGQILYGPLRR